MVHGHDESVYSRARIGERLKLLREVEGLNQSQMARQVGTERANWNNWELGKVTIPIEQVWKVIQIFGVSSDWLYFGIVNGMDEKVRKRLFSHARKSSSKTV